MSFVNTIENISNILKSNSNTNSNMEKAMELLVLSIMETKSTTRFIKDITLVLLSNNVNALRQCKETFKSYGYSIPKFIIWNIENIIFENFRMILMRKVAFFRVCQMVF